MTPPLVSNFSTINKHILGNFWPPPSRSLRNVKDPLGENWASPFTYYIHLSYKWNKIQVFIKFVRIRIPVQNFLCKISTPKKLDSTFFYVNVLSLEVLGRTKEFFPAKTPRRGGGQRPPPSRGVLAELKWGYVRFKLGFFPTYRWKRIFNFINIIFWQGSSQHYGTL